MEHLGRGTRTLPSFVGSLLALGTLTSPTYAQQTAECPIPAEEYGVPVARTFTDSEGRSAEIFVQLPEGHDVTVPSGILMYFHGNDSDPSDSYVAPLYELEERAAKHGLVPVGLKSQTVRAEDGNREWVSSDGLILEELLLSDFGGCFALDRSKVYLEGASQGTCFLSANLTIRLWRNFSGGVLGLCGCWGWSEFDWPLDIPTLRDRFKVYVENTTEDFLYTAGIAGLDLYKYNFGMDVRADLDRPGEHCENSRENAELALDWMLGEADYPDPDAGLPHWQIVDWVHNGLGDITYDDQNQRFVAVVQRSDISDEERETINDMRNSPELVDDPQGFLDWRLANYPSYAQPPVQVRTTSDYGATWNTLAVIPTVEGENLIDAIAAPDGSILIQISAYGVQRLDEATGTLVPHAHADLLIYGMDRADNDNLFVHGALVGVQRSEDSGVTWTELDVPFENRNAEHVVVTFGTTLSVLGDDAMLRISQDGGDTFSEGAPLPAAARDFTHNGSAFWLLSEDGTMLYVSEDAGQSWQSVPLPDPDAGLSNIAVSKEGDLLAQVSTGLAYRSSDVGASFQRERGLHVADRQEFAFGPDDQTMMVTTRSILRYSTGAPLDLGEPLPPVSGDEPATTTTTTTSGGGSSGTTGATGSSTEGATAGGGTTSTASASTASGTTGSPASGNDSGGGCACRAASSPHAPGSAPWLFAVLFAALGRRFRGD